MNNLIAIIIILISSTVVINHDSNYNLFTKSAGEWESSNYSLAKYSIPLYLYKNCEGDPGLIDSFYQIEEVGYSYEKLQTHCDIKSLKSDVQRIIGDIMSQTNNSESLSGYLDSANKLKSLLEKSEK